MKYPRGLEDAFKNIRNLREYNEEDTGSIDYKTNMLGLRSQLIA
jgi:hypothetical protein